VKAPMIPGKEAAARFCLARQAPAGLAERPIDGPPTTEGQCTRRGPTAGAGNKPARLSPPRRSRRT
jgi:hypothetical protein